MANKKGTVYSGGQWKFPVNNPGQARNAMARLNEAKPPLTPSQKRTVARAVENELHHPTARTTEILHVGRKNK